MHYSIKTFQDSKLKKNLEVAVSDLRRNFRRKTEKVDPKFLTNVSVQSGSHLQTWTRRKDFAT